MDLFQAFDKGRPVPAAIVAEIRGSSSQDHTCNNRNMDPSSAAPPTPPPPPTKSSNAQRQLHAQQKDANAASLTVGFHGYHAAEAEPISQLQAQYPITPSKNSNSASRSSGTTSEQPRTLSALSPRSASSIDEPIPFNQPSSSGSVSLLYHICTNRHVDPVFEFFNVVDNLTWACRLSVITRDSIADAARIPSQKEPNSVGLYKEIWEEWDPVKGKGALIVQDRSSYATKKVAKEHVADMALPVLRCLPAFRQESSRSTPQGHRLSGPEENCVGKLLEFCNATGDPHPKYQEFKAGQGFACELHFESRPHHIFGSRHESFPNKKLAKAAAAQGAIIWLRESGRMAEMEARQKKKSKKKPASPTPHPAEPVAKSRRPAEQPTESNIEQPYQQPVMGKYKQQVEPYPGQKVNQETETRSGRLIGHEIRQQLEHENEHDPEHETEQPPSSNFGLQELLNDSAAVRNLPFIKHAVLTPVPAPSSRPSEENPDDDSSEKLSYTVKVRALCASLHMKEPIYTTKSDPNEPMLFSVTAIFSDARDLARLHLFRILSRGKTDVGVVDVKVKAHALDQCAKLVFELLSELQSSMQAAELAGLHITAPGSSDSIAPLALPHLVKDATASATLKHKDSSSPGTEGSTES